MPWARLDDGFHDHPKVDGLSLAAVGLYTLCLTWAHRHRRTALIQGHVTVARVKKVAGRQADTLAAELVASGLWEVEPNSGWIIHDFADYLPKERDPDERREAGKKGAASRWQGHGKPDGKLPTGSMASDSSRASAPAYPSRPVPSPTTSAQERGQRTETLDPADARCSKHFGVADPGPCRGCMKAREHIERVIAARQDAAIAAADNCPDCHGDHWLIDIETGDNLGRCDHRRTA